MRNMELLCTQCRGIGPQLAALGTSHGFSRVAAGSWVIFSSYRVDGHSKLVSVQRCQDSCLVMRDTSAIFSRLGSAIQMLLKVRRETQSLFQGATLILGFLSIFNKSQASSPFEALNSACLSRSQSDVMPPVQTRWLPSVFSRVHTGDSDIPSSFEMKDDPAFKPMQGNPAFFPVRASQCQLQFRQQTQGPSHIPIAEGSLLLSCLWKVCIPLQSKPGNQLSSRDDLLCTELSSICCAESCVPLDLTRVHQGISGLSQRKSNLLSHMMWITGWLWSHCRGIWLHLESVWCTPIYFAFLR